MPRIPAYTVRIPRYEAAHANTSSRKNLSYLSSPSAIQNMSCISLYAVPNGSMSVISSMRVHDFSRLLNISRGSIIIISLLFLNTIIEKARTYFLNYWITLIATTDSRTVEYLCKLLHFLIIPCLLDYRHE